MWAPSLTSTQAALPARGACYMPAHALPAHARAAHAVMHASLPPPGSECSRRSHVHPWHCSPAPMPVGKFSQTASVRQEPAGGKAGCQRGQRGGIRADGPKWRGRSREWQKSHWNTRLAGDQSQMEAALCRPRPARAHPHLSHCAPATGGRQSPPRLGRQGSGPRRASACRCSGYHRQCVAVLAGCAHAA